MLRIGGVGVGMAMTVEGCIMVEDGKRLEGGGDVEGIEAVGWKKRRDHYQIM